MALVIIVGCNMPVKQIEDTSWRDHLLNIYLLEPGIIGAASEMNWGFTPLTPRQTENFLAKRLPGPNDVKPGASVLDVLSDYTGKRIIVIPEDGTDVVIREFGISAGHAYSTMCRSDGISVGECLFTIISSSASLTGNWREEEDAFSPFPNPNPRPPQVYHVLITKNHILFLLLPLDK